MTGYPAGAGLHVNTVSIYMDPRKDYVIRSSTSNMCGYSSCRCSQNFRLTCNQTRNNGMRRSWNHDAMFESLEKFWKSMRLNSSRTIDMHLHPHIMAGSFALVLTCAALLTMSSRVTQLWFANIADRLVPWYTQLTRTATRLNIIP